MLPSLARRLRSEPGNGGQGSDRVLTGKLRNTARGEDRPGILLHSQQRTVGGCCNPQEPGKKAL